MSASNRKRTRINELRHRIETGNSPDALWIAKQLLKDEHEHPSSGYDSAFGTLLAQTVIADAAVKKMNKKLREVRGVK